jgi:hydrogenase expression/formation protein HypE
MVRDVTQELEYPAITPGEPTCIVRAHGGGGEMMNGLIRRHILGALGNAALAPLTDGAILMCASPRIVMTTDSFVVEPLEFPGGDIGRLAVCGTINDLAVMGAEPLALSLGLIVEEGVPLALLDRVFASIAATAREAGVPVVTGDTKVIEHRNGGLMLNTTGLGALRDDLDLGLHRVQPSDLILVNGTLGDHGMAVMSVRNGLEFDTVIRSDAAPLADLVQGVLRGGVDLRFMRDATRGGLAGVLADIVDGTDHGVVIREADVPVRPAVRAATEMLGFDVLTVANEGKIVFVVARADADRCLDILRGHPFGREASVIGEVTAASVPLVELETVAGGRRIVQRPYGEELPRIC